MAARYTFQGGLILLTGIVGGGLIGCCYGGIQASSAQNSDWRLIAAAYDIQQLDRFIVTACIHNGSYLGALAGLLAAVIYVKRRPSLGADDLTPPAET